MRQAWGIIAFGLVAAIGCGGSDPYSRQPVSGTVTYKGKPLVYGQIEFYPASGQKTPLTLEVTDGKFATSKQNGLSAGKYDVRISGFDGPLPKPSQEEAGKMLGPMPKPVIPEKYNTKSTLSAEIKAGDKNEIAFNLD